MDEDTSLEERKAAALGLIDKMGHVLNLMLCLAAPRVWARLPSDKVSAWRTTALAALDDYLALPQQAAGPAAAGDAPFTRSIEPTQRVRASLAAWSFEGPVPEAVVQAARDFHQALYGVTEPAGGWDAFELPET